MLCVGAFDGATNDRLGRFVRAHECVGAFLEPQPRAFERLRATLAGLPGIRPINAAVDRTPGRRELHYVAPDAPGLPEWTQQIASFDRAHLEKHETASLRLAPWIRSSEVDVVSFDGLLTGPLGSRLDYLQIDAEGHDAELLEAFPFDRVRPALLQFESTHLNAETRERWRTRLERIGYVLPFPAESPDTVAVRL